MPLFSVIIPAYNREGLIAATLRSVLEQSFTDFEIIVVDDASTDRTLGVVRAFGDRVRVFEQPNSGPGVARNLGARHARGEYLAFLDSDDLWFPWTLETFRQVIADFDRPSIISGQPHFFDDESTLAGVACRSVKATRHADYLSADPAAALPGAGLMVVRAEAFAAAGGFTSRRVYSEDADLYMRLGTAAGLVTIHAPPTLAYRRHAGSAMHDTRRIAEGLEMMLDTEARGEYPGGEARRANRWHILAHACRNVAANAARAGLPGLGWRVYRRSWRANLAEGRWKFLLGFPPMVLASALGLVRSGDLHGAGVRRGAGQA